MSGSTGADRIQSREHFKQFLSSYEKILKHFTGFESLEPSGSYNSNPNKQDFGDIDIVVHIASPKSKAEVKKELQQFFNAMPDSLIVPFSSPKYMGKKSANTGEIVTIRYFDKKNGYSVQIDNIIALDKSEAEFKKRFLDIPAEAQGLILGLTKVATLEQDPKILFKSLGIPYAPLEKDQEYAFNLSSVEIQLRKVTYVPNTFKEEKREIIWTSRKFQDLEKILHQFDINTTFDNLLKQADVKLKNPRSKVRMSGVFKSMISVKSGEIGTPKGNEKQRAIDTVNKLFGESYISFKDYLTILEETSNAKIIARLEYLSKMLSKYKHRWGYDGASNRMYTWVDEYDHIKDKNKEAWKEYCNKHDYDVSHDGRDNLA